MQLETPACERRSCPHLVAGNSRWQCVMVTSCTWSFPLHFEPLLKCKWDFLSASYLDAWQQFCLICDLSASCYRHKMQLGTLACQENVMCTFNGRSICIASRPQNANEISCPLSYLDAWKQFCLISDLSACGYCHQMLWLVGKRSFARLMVVPSAFWAARKRQMRFLVRLVTYICGSSSV